MPLPPRTPFPLEKTIWSNSDFDRMSWHDNPIHAIRWAHGHYPNSFYLDIDYIFAWDGPVREGQNYSFWVAPCTLVFHDVTAQQINTRAELGYDDLPTITGIKRSPVPVDDLRPGFPAEWVWTIEMVEGQILMRSTGYTQYLRKNPVQTQQQVLDQAERGGISFDCLRAE